MDYRTRAGDTMSGISRRFAVSLTDLEAANPQIADPGLIFVNELVHLPAAAHTQPVTTVPPHVVTYVVQPGDTMGRIAAAHNLTLATLEAANPQVADPDLIHPGQVLNLTGTHRSAGNPASSPASVPASTPTSKAAAIRVDQVGYALFHGDGDVGSWTTQACHLLELSPDNWVQGYRVLCQRESSGRPNAINNYDVNAHGAVQGDGYPLHCSRGVAQCIPDTFAHYHAAGTTTDIYDPVANIAASIRYVITRYGVAGDGSDLTSRVQQADATRNPMGY